MKIIFLNAWHANSLTRASLTSFLNQHVSDTDVFCLQETESPFAELAKEIFTDFVAVSDHKYVTDDDNFYLSTYVKKSVKLEASGTIFEGEDQVGLGVYTKLALGEKYLTVCNIHGISRPIDKTDTPGRWRQTEGLVEICKNKGPSVIGGDFNVFPTNESLQVFEKAGFRDLIKQFSITNTRNHFVWDRYPENPKQYYSDYAFVSPDVTVNSFVAPDVDVSDHTPLVLDISL